MTPDETVDRFGKRITELLDYYDELLLAVRGKIRESTLKGILGEQTVMSTAVLWEAFVNDLLLAHILSEPATCFNNLRQRIKQSLSSKFAGAAAYARFSFPLKPSRDLIAKVIDPDGWNITAPSSDALAKRANDLLGASSAKKFSLGGEDRTFLDYVICLRNYISHRRSGRDVN